MASPASRRELVRLMVLREISDDYENLTVSIEPPILEDSGRCGLAIERSEIVGALKELVELGWATAYLPQSKELVEIARCRHSTTWRVRTALGSISPTPA
jgi:hypothetical protein